VVEWESMAASAKRGCETEAAAGNKREKQKKDVKSWEQTEGFIESKGVRGFQGEKQTGFLAQKPPNKAKNRAQNAEFRGWKKETGNTDLGRCRGIRVRDVEVGNSACLKPVLRLYLESCLLAVAGCFTSRHRAPGL
jgi:hypothetical protein